MDSIVHLIKHERVRGWGCKTHQLQALPVGEAWVHIAAAPSTI